MICEICERRECTEPWKMCDHCRKKHEECVASEDKIRQEMRKELGNLIGTTTPGMKRFGCSVNERRGRKMIRPVRQEVFLEGSEDEPE